MMMRCENCGAERPEEMIDMKPPRLAGPDHTRAELEDALWNNEDCTRAECVACYGPGWTADALLPPASLIIR